MPRMLMRLALALPLAATLVSAQSDGPALDEVLKAAGAFVSTYERGDSLVGQEEYSQQVTRNQRTLRSDILFIKDEAFGWVEFRDVLASDGLPVRDRQERLLELFTRPNPNRFEQALRVVAEGARFNLNPPNARVNRTINLPLTAIRFLRPASQSRSSFRIARWNAETGIVTLDFTEQHRPRVIKTPDAAPAIGRFDVDRATGRVTSSTLTLMSGDTIATITVKFAWDAKVELGLPQTMDEEYRGPFFGFVTGHAKYSNYRRFRVDTSETLKH